jgi:hypothetical protein
MDQQPIPVLFDVVITAEKDCTYQDLEQLKQSISAIDWSIVMRRAIIDMGVPQSLANKVSYEALAIKRRKR